MAGAIYTTGTTLKPWRCSGPITFSTVDSGNFIGYLIVLKNGLRELKRSAGIPGCFAGSACGIRWKWPVIKTKTALLPDKKTESWLADIQMMENDLDQLQDTWQNIDWMPKLKKDL